MQELLTDIWEQHQLTVLFVTHDVEEAVFISDRVLVMTNRPGRIKDEITVPLGGLGACLGEPAGQRTSVRARFRVEDPNGDGRHRPSLAAARAPTGRTCRDTWVVPERRVRAYIGLGANLGEAEVI